MKVDIRGLSLPITATSYQGMPYNIVFKNRFQPHRLIRIRFESCYEIRREEKTCVIKMMCTKEMSTVIAQMKAEEKRMVMIREEYCIILIKYSCHLFLMTHFT